MKTPSSRALAFAGAALMLAACSSGGATSPTPGTAGLAALPAGHFFGQHPVPFITAQAFKAHRDRHKTWFSKDIKKYLSSKVLFAVDSGTYDVYMYALPTFQVIGTITGLNFPQGACNDNVGDVWVTATYSETIVEYDHHGLVVNTLTDPDGLPVGCAWDKKTGNLAVANIFNNGSGQPPGEVLIYPDATGTPVAYANPAFYYYYSPAYDMKGNLFVSGTGAYPDYPFVLARLPRRGTQTLNTLGITGGTIYMPGGLQWDNSTSHLLAGDQECGGSYSPETSCTYALSLSLSGLNATINGTVALNNGLHQTACDIVQTVKLGQYIYGGDWEYAAQSGYFCTSNGSEPALSIAGATPGAATHREPASTRSKSPTA